MQPCQYATDPRHAHLLPFTLVPAGSQHILAHLGDIPGDWHAQHSKDSHMIPIQEKQHTKITNVPLFPRTNCV